MAPIRSESSAAHSIRAGLSAGSVCGLLFGLADGIVAANLDAVRASFLALAGCLAAAVLQYTLVWMAALAVLGLLLHVFLRGAAASRSYLVLLRAGVAAGLFAEITWWTRPYVFYGHAVASPERLLSMAAIAAVAGAAGFALAGALVQAPARWKRAAAVVSVVAWTGGAAFLLFHRNAVGPRGELGPRNRDLPNVLLVIVDALRRDALGCYGNLRVKTPHIDRLAAEGVLFEDAFTQAPYTWSSFGSILTGKYPRRHGLLHMKAGVRMPPNQTLGTILKSATRSDGGELADADWLAATFHTGTLTASSGLLGGFDMRYEATAGHDLVVLASPWSTFRSGLLLSILRNKFSQHLELGGTAEEACRWIDSHGDRRFFAMVHLYSTHTPYDPPADFARLYCDPAYDGPVKSFWAEHRKLIESGRYKPTLADVSQIRNLYYGGVSEADAQVGTLLETLERKGVLDDTLVIVTADHGESLGEQDLWEHDHMVQTNLRIPLVLRWPKHLPARRRVPGLVDEIDILPTVCDLLGIVPRAGSGEQDRIDGRSLLPLVRGEIECARDHSFAENAVSVAVQDHRWKLVVPQAALLGERGWEQALEKQAGRPRLFDLERDPEEKFDQLDKSREIAERLFAVVRDWNARLPIPPDSLLESDRDRENQDRLLFQLGYTGGELRDDGTKQ